MEIIWRAIGQEILQMVEAQPTMIKVQPKFSFTNINTGEKFLKQTKLGKHGVNFRTEAIRRGGSAREWTSIGTSASSGEEKVGVRLFIVYIITRLIAASLLHSCFCFIAFWQPLL